MSTAQNTSHQQLRQLNKENKILFLKQENLEIPINLVRTSENGVFAAAHDFKTEWGVVKGIKNFVDDRKSSSKTWKQIACVMAASVVANILSDPIIFQDWPHFNAAVSGYTTALKTSILSQTEFQPKLIASRTISNVKTDEIFTNLLIQYGRKALIRSDETYYSMSEELEYYGKVSDTPVKHCDEIFLSTSDDLENRNSILVAGKAGIGKSLFCQKLMRDWANNELFQARENAKIPNEKILKGAIVLITSRPDESHKLGGINFERYVEIAGLSSKQVKEYIEKYFKKNEKMKNSVLEHVMKNENLVSFAHIPMLCYLLCFEMKYTLTESENPRDVPVSTTDIYTKLIDIFKLQHCADSEYRQKEIPEQFKPPPVIKTTLEKLPELAAKLLLERKPTFDESEIENEFELEEVNKLKGSGLLYCDQPFRNALITITKHFSFTHLTVQEFLAPRWFVKESYIPEEDCSAMVFQFMAGIFSSEGNEELMEKIVDQSSSFRV
ncbi:Protein NLRC5 [Stylophora pistillata]|uniref:Protein NLRC5 n=1 Tax=Stylophora pistillata TaxID=50429 RepID=A0A2B4RB32_STYPI|nr:Protein NLRC5 [Stylophora pistillata]